LPNIDDGNSGWYRLASDEKSISLSEEVYRSVEKVVINNFCDEKSELGHMELFAENMTKCLVTWSKLWCVPRDILKNIFLNGHYYILFQNEIEDMIKSIQRHRLHNGKTKDKVGSACIEVLLQISKANSLLPKGYNDRQQEIIDKVFNMKNAGFGSVPYHEEFYQATRADDFEKEENGIVTPEKVEKTTTEISKMRKTQKRFSEKDVYMSHARKKVKEFFDNIHDNEDDEDDDVSLADNAKDGRLNGEKVNDRTTVSEDSHILAQKYVGKSSILAMIAAQAPVLQRNPGQENRKLLQVMFTTPIRQAKGTYKVAIFIDSIDGNSEKQIYTWKAKPLIHALSLTRSLDGLYLGDRKDIYTNVILQGLNKYMPIRRYPGESNDDIKKKNGAYLHRNSRIYTV
jgi:hypothetical protein